MKVASQLNPVMNPHKTIEEIQRLQKTTNVLRQTKLFPHEVGNYFDKAKVRFIPQPSSFIRVWDRLL
jgi:hypothetical protein